MAQRHSETALDTAAAPAPPAGAPGTAALPAGEVLGRYLGDQASAFLRALRLRETDEAEAARRMRRAARRIGAALHTFQPLAEPEWAERLRTELSWLTGVLGREHQYAERLTRLTDALQRLSGQTPPATEPPGSASGDGLTAPASTLGAARAGALLERRLTLARTRAHSAALQALGSARFHALADAVAVLVSEVPLSPAGAQPAGRVLLPLAEAAHHRLAEAADALPLGRSGYAYNFDPLHSSLTATVTVVGSGDSAGEQLGTDRQDAPWHRTRVLARISRYAMEVASPEQDPASSRQAHAGLVLQRHREAAEAAAAAASAALTPRIAPATAYALGVLHADQRQQVEAARYAFSRLWHRQVANVS